MKKYISCVVGTLILALGINIFANNNSFLLEEMDAIIYYGDEMLEFTDQSGNKLPVLSYNDVTYVPLRSYSEQLDKTVDYSQSAHSEEIVIGDVSLFGEEYGQRYREVERTSLINLIADPDVYNEKRVSVSGIINIGFEDNFLFLTANDWKYFSINNAVDLGIQANEALGVEISELQSLSGKYVNIEGIFYKNTDDPNGVAGGLGDINYIEVMGD